MDLGSSKYILIWFDAERNWNIALPGFAGDEIKSYRKPVRIVMCFTVLYCVVILSFDDDLIDNGFAAC